MAKLNKKTPEDILGINAGANEEEIKVAYRRLAMKYHPDHNKAPDAEEKFKELGGALATLKKRTNLKSLLDFDLNDFELNLSQPDDVITVARVGNVMIVEKRYHLEKKKPRLGSG